MNSLGRPQILTVICVAALSLVACKPGSGPQSLREKLKGSLADKEDNLLAELDQSDFRPRSATKSEPRPLIPTARKSATNNIEEEKEADIETNLIETSAEEDDDDLLRLTERIRTARLSVPDETDELDDDLLELEDGDEEDGEEPASKNLQTRDRKKVAKAETEAEPDPAVGCPTNGRIRGAAPPKGIEQWCEIPASDGQPLRHGVYTRWDNKGTKRLVASYHQGKLHGISTTFHANGNIEQQRTYRAGEVAGPWIRYHKSGAKEVEIGIVNGKRNGKFARWDKNGNIQIEGYFTNDQRSGQWTQYGKNGKARSQVTWKNGQRDGKATFFYPTGQIQRQGVYRNGSVEGAWTYFTKDGRPQVRTPKAQQVRASRMERRSSGI